MVADPAPSTCLGKVLADILLASAEVRKLRQVQPTRWFSGDCTIVVGLFHLVNSPLLRQINANARVDAI